MTAVLLWFRQDLRLDDNPALVACGDRPVLPVFVLDNEAAGAFAHGGAQRWWLDQSLRALAAALAARGAPLHLARGRAEEVIPALAAAIGAEEVQAGRLTEPWARRRDEAVAEKLRAEGRKLLLHTSALLLEPHRVRTKEGKPYGVYTPFSRAIFALGDPPAPLPSPARLTPVAGAPAGLAVDELALLPGPPIPAWWSEFSTLWEPGEAGAQARIARFVARAIRGYDSARNLPAVDGTSGLSPHLRWGEVSPRQVWHAARAAGVTGDSQWLKEIVWREFSHHLLWHRPEMVDTPLNPAFARFPAEPDTRLLRAWKAGRTGYPIVDAGMRQLWRTGWMHNRVRMIAASLLVKHLLQPWQAGAACFWDRLVDADLASNSASWQWVAGCGADAAPYFRVFNPVLQGEKFDPDGAYVKRWVPELRDVPSATVHKPWEGLLRPRGYPAPIIPHAEGRQRALAAYAAMRA
ncbi:MAG: DNA photolyase family protein [Acetobacteraceae bacterium]|nr:DNA photolyase family protein [Acetobacteraceae bacterium]